MESKSESNNKSLMSGEEDIHWMVGLGERGERVREYRKGNKRNAYRKRPSDSSLLLPTSPDRMPKI